MPPGPIEIQVRGIGVRRHPISIVLSALLACGLAEDLKRPGHDGQGRRRRQASQRAAHALDTQGHVEYGRIARGFWPHPA
jgi:hypothetical protein